MKNTATIFKHRVITIQYTLTNDNGISIREASRAPVQYLHGAGTLFPKLEAALENHKVGDIVRVRLLPHDAFGTRNVDLLCQVPKDEFPEGETITAGGRVVGKDVDGKDVDFRITDIRNDIAYLDANHPLSGQTLVFEVEVREIRDASEEEIRAGSVLTGPV